MRRYADLSKMATTAQSFDIRSNQLLSPTVRLPLVAVSPSPHSLKIFNHPLTTNVRVRIIRQVPRRRRHGLCATHIQRVFHRSTLLPPRPHTLEMRLFVDRRHVTQGVWS